MITWIHANQKLCVRQYVSVSKVNVFELLPMQENQKSAVALPQPVSHDNWFSCHSALFFSFVCWVLIKSGLSGPSWIPHHFLHLWDVNWFWLLRFVVSSTNGNRTECCIYSANPQAFSVIFQKAVLKAEPDEDLTQRVSNLIESITSSLFQYTTRGLFECDKLTYIAQLTFQVQAWNGCLICYIVCLENNLTAESITPPETCQPLLQSSRKEKCCMPKIYWFELIQVCCFSRFWWWIKI